MLSSALAQLSNGQKFTQALSNMTRITNFGRKRTYVEAGFNSEPSQTTGEIPADVTTTNHKTSGTAESLVLKKRKRTKKPKLPEDDAGEGRLVSCLSNDIGGSGIRSQDDSSMVDATKSTLENEVDARRKTKNKKKKASWRTEQSELRRQKRIAERQADTICFACREKGHAARDCPSSRLEDGPVNEANSKIISGVGLCYRCGSKRHTLSRCKKPSDPLDPLPFASCFVCSGKGHLASSCPQNKARGIYPNGGSCKLCGDITHLAKNCGLRKSDASNNISMSFGPAVGGHAGADEDDFLAFKRQTAQIDQDEKKEERVIRSMEVKAGVHSGVVKAFGKQPFAPAKKVVYF